MSVSKLVHSFVTRLSVLARRNARWGLDFGRRDGRTWDGEFSLSLQECRVRDDEFLSLFDMEISQLLRLHLSTSPSPGLPALHGLRLSAMTSIPCSPSLPGDVVCTYVHIANTDTAGHDCNGVSQPDLS